MENHNVNSKINYKRAMFNSFQITNLGLYINSFTIIYVEVSSNFSLFNHNQSNDHLKKHTLW